MNDLLNSALRYARRGWRVFPLKPNGKEPLILDNLNKATTSKKRIRRWWDRWPDANIGIACDSEHGPIVIDMDKPKPHEVDGFQFLKKLKAMDKLITRTAMSRKGRWHLYLEPMRNGTRIKRMIRPFRDKSGRKVAIDILGDGGYVVAPPSIHPDTGKPYRWTEKIDLIPFPKSIFRHLQTKDIFNIAPPLPEVIREGERDTLLTSLAGTMRRRNMSPEAILEALRVENAARVRPPLPDRALRKIARSIGKKAPASDDEHLTDMGNARRFIAMHHKMIRSVALNNRHPYFVWHSTRWVQDIAGEVYRMAKNTVRVLFKEASECADEERRDQLLKWAIKSESAPRIHALIDMASTESELCLMPEQMDKNIRLFNCENGTIDLRTGKLKPHTQSDYITKISPTVYDPHAKCPRWKQFLREVLVDDELIAFVQRAIGYSMTGNITEHCFFFCYGQGRNGKSTFLEVIRTLFGDYAVQSDFTSFQSMRGDGPRSDIARMKNARLVTAIEARSDRGFDATVLKQMTGGDTVVARRLYEDLAEFKPQFKLWLAANHKPLVNEQTDAFWSRVRMVPFTVTIPTKQRQKNLTKVLVDELPGILNWAIAGCRSWHKHGLMPPDTVKQANREYKEEYDILGEFIDAHCVLDRNSWTSGASLYQAFTDWWTETRGHRSQPISMVAFGRMISERKKFAAKKRRNIRGWQGISVKDVQSE